MATWKKILVEGDAVVDNLATADLTCTSTTRSFKLASGMSILSFENNSSENIFSMVANGSVMTTSLSGGMQIIEDASGQQACLKLFAEDAASDYVCLMANGSATADQTITFPAAGPTGANQILESDASGNLSWIDTPSGGGGGVVTTYTNGVDNRVITSSGSDSINGEANMTFNGTTLVVTGRVEPTDNIRITTNNKSLFGVTSGSANRSLAKVNTSGSVEIGDTNAKKHQMVICTCRRRQCVVLFGYKFCCLVGM